MLTHTKSSFVLALLILSGCSSFGPDSLTGTHSLYNHAIVTSLNEQFLQNLVRLRYRDTPYFLEIASITASLRFEAALGLDTAVSTGSGPDLLSPSAGVAYSTTPTISYAPLQGEDFLKNLLTPISLESLFVLMQSGWRASRVLGICVERINDLENAPTASGPTPDSPPAHYRDFQQLLTLLEAVRNEEAIRSKIELEPNTLIEDLLGSRIAPQTKKLVVEMKSAPDREKTIREIKRLMALDPDRAVYAVDSDFLSHEGDTIAIRTRSIMSILFYLSQTVDAPEAHQQAGLVTVTKNADGSAFDWTETPGGQFFRIRHARNRPDSAYLAVPYRGYWFYIEDSDLDSKSSFMLMSQLFNLKAGLTKRTGPTLTIPVSR